VLVSNIKSASCWKLIFVGVGTVPQPPAPGVEIPSGVGRLASLGTNSRRGSAFSQLQARTSMLCVALY
jgi:hypothetical protein